MRIKGTFLKDYAQLVANTPELEWDRFLTPEDWEIVRNIIIPSQWYPVETMAHIGRGIFIMRSKGSYEVVRMAGRARATDHFDEAAKNFLLKDDPEASLKAYTMIAGRYIDEVKLTMEDSGPKFARVCFYPVDDAPAWDLFREIQAGTLEKLVEMNGGAEPRAEFISEKRQGREACIIQVSWK